MSLKSRLQSKRRSKSIPDDIDLIKFFEENSDIDTLTIYSYNNIRSEKNGVISKSGFTFLSETAYRKEIYNIAELYENIPTNENPCSKINISDDITMKIMVPPIVSDGIFTVISRKSAKKEISAENFVSEEITAYLKECLKQKLNIFVIGSADTDKTGTLEFLSTLCDKNSKLIVSDKNNNFYSDKLNCLKIRDFYSNISDIPFDNIIVNDINNSELIKIFELIMSGYKGFVVSLSLKNNSEIFETLRNKILLTNPNLFEENADFMSSSAIDVALFLEKSGNNTKITRISENFGNSLLRDIFTLDEKGQYISVGNRSRFFNKTNSPMNFSERYLRKDYVHSFEETADTAENCEDSSDFEEKTITKHEKFAAKLEKIKNKIRNGKKAEEEKAEVEKAEEENSVKLETEPESTETTEKEIQKQDNFHFGEFEEIAEQTPINENILPEQTIFETKVNDAKPEIIESELPEEKAETFDISSSFDNFINTDKSIYSNEGILASDTDDFQVEESQPVAKPKFMNIFEDTENVNIPQKYGEYYEEDEIVEEPELFSEIKDVEVSDNEDFDIQDESI